MMALRFPRFLQPVRCRAALIVGMCLLLCQILSDSPVLAQSKSNASATAGASELPLIDQPPFDLIRLNDAAGGRAVKIAPIPLPNRMIKPSPVAGKKIEVILLSHEDRRYEIAWSDIAQLELYELMIYDEAVRKLKEKDFVTAFQNLSFLMRKYPEIVGLERLREEFLFNSAMTMFASGRFTQTLATLEELYKTAPGYQPDSVLNGLNRVSDSIIKQYIDKNDFISARAMLERLRNDFSDKLSSVRAWRAKLQSLAAQKKQEAVKLMEAGDYRNARRASLAMLSIFPAEAEAKEVFNEINRRHPMVRVGVMQSSSELDPASLTNWPARRCGALIEKPLVEFLETGAEGGRYGFSLGLIRHSDDRQELTLELEPSLAGSLDAFTVAQSIFQRTDPQHADYDPSWAAIAHTVSVPSPTTIRVRLQRPNVLPQALMQWKCQLASTPTNPFDGSFRQVDSVENENAFQLRQPPTERDAPIEIIEIFYDDPKSAVNDLLKGELEVLDQLFPADATRLANNAKIQVGSYALPTVHMLVPVSEYEFLADQRFRRALMYASDRESILNEELLGSTSSNDGRIISGPFPSGIDSSDPLSYAYNSAVKPIEFEPRLSKLLLFMVDQDFAEKAEKLGKPVPQKRKIVVATPDFELAQVAVQAIIQQWALVGIDAEMVILPRGKVTDINTQYDLLYVTASMWEPLTDIERLFGEQGIARSNNPYIIQALARLRSARNWREVRTYLQDMHQLVDYHLPVLPLWQIADRFAVASSLAGLSDKPLTLYQNIAAWRINHLTADTVTRQ